MGRAKSAGGLGFRDLLMFNKALLAKQCWRLVQFPHSLSSRILKAKYFPNSSFLASELGKRPSFIWRSFLAAKDLLSSGITWRVGDGKSINIWGDNWLPNFGVLNFQSELFLHRDAKVSDLIDVSIRGWNDGLIDICFPARIWLLCCNENYSTYAVKILKSSNLITFLFSHTSLFLIQSRLLLFFTQSLLLPLGPYREDTFSLSLSRVFFSDSSPLKCPSLLKQEATYQLPFLLQQKNCASMKFQEETL
jgi:hypothetical protein